MSQITRCPSCGTKFKVVADQLRISDGWVRCGHCKEVFDASGNLILSAPAPLLPEVSLTDIKPPMMPVARSVSVNKPWGGPAQAPVAVVPAMPMPTSATTADALLHEVPSQVAVKPSAPQADGEPDQVLGVPAPSVPAFLAKNAEKPMAVAGELSLEPIPLFGWGAQKPQLQGAGLAPSSSALQVGASAPSESAATPLMGPPPPLHDQSVPGKNGGFSLDHMLAVESMRDTQKRHSSIPPEPIQYPTLDEEAFLESIPPAPVIPQSRKRLSQRGAVKEAKAALPVADVPSASASSTADGALPLHTLKKAPASSSKKAAKPQAAQASHDERVLDDGDEVSFVRSARRKAFWQKPWVRAGSTVIAVLLLLTLVLQIGVQERNRIAAIHAKARPWLEYMCQPLQCVLVPQRQIADVVIDSSSFNKGRGDSYQLALTIKNRANIPLATPAVELTLTDSQDQPVLRRVLTPADMAAAVELPARGEWTASVAVVVTTGGARVAGYRVLTFYP